MAINVVGFENVQFVDFNPDPASGVPNDLFLITGVALIQPFTGTAGNQGGWTRRNCNRTWTASVSGIKTTASLTWRSRMCAVSGMQKASSSSRS